jgi:hypothetical protein
MTKQEMIKKLKKDSHYFFDDRVKDCFKNEAGHISGYLCLKTNENYDWLDKITDIGHYVSEAHNQATDTALSYYADQCPECDGWFLTNELVHDHNINGKEGFCQECFDDIMESCKSPDPMTVAHQYKEENK